MIEKPQERNDIRLVIMKLMRSSFIMLLVQIGMIEEMIQTNIIFEYTFLIKLHADNPIMFRSMYSRLYRHPCEIIIAIMKIDSGRPPIARVT